MQLISLAVAAVVASIALPVSAAGEGWRYASSEDKMTGKRDANATVVSDNRVSLKFPYQEGTSAGLSIRQHPRNGLQVLLQVERGQILCNPSNCAVVVRFDDGKPVGWPGSPTASFTPTAMFIDSEPKFLAQAKKAKRIRIQVRFFQDGDFVFDFTLPDPLKWPLPAG